MGLKSSLAGVAAGVVFVVGAARADILTITQDTYLDSTYSIKNGLVVADTQDTNFDTNTTPSGSSNTPSNQRIKAVSSNGSTQFPGNSRVHGLFIIPSSFWTEFDAGQVVSATVNFYIFNNSLNTGLATNAYTDSRDVELHPMTHTFVYNQATWRTYDGTHFWSTSDSTSDHDDPGTGGGGGEYDTTRSVNTVDPNVAAGGIVSWNITPLLSDPTAVGELRNNGALLKVSNETVFEANRFYSLYSFDDPGTHQPFMNVTLTPEPSLVLIGLLAPFVPVRSRRGKHA